MNVNVNVSGSKSNTAWRYHRGQQWPSSADSGLTVSRDVGMLIGSKELSKN